MPLSSAYSPSTSHAALGEAFYDVVAPARFPRHVIRHRNDRWAARVGLAWLSDDEWTAHFGRFEPLPGSFPAPLALRYHGHQFQSYNSELGDGRGFLFAQLHDDRDGRLLDLGTKGSGRTPWSRAGDGRLTLKGGVREVLATEMLEARGVDTSKSFSLIETGEALVRGDEPSPTRSAVLVRLSHSHIRIGTFQRLLYLDDRENIARLLDYTVATYMPDIRRASAPEQAVAFLEEVCRRVATTGAAWMLAGFVHGVLNTDNINVTGESFDYGPWRFLPAYDPAFTAAYFDHSGLYAYGRQPTILFWNLTRLAECLLPLAPQAELEAGLGAFAPALRAAYWAGTLRRLGIRSGGEVADARLIEAFWTFMAEAKAPFEGVLFDLYGGGLARADSGSRAALYAEPFFTPVREILQSRKPAPEARLDHPYFARAEPCGMLVDEVEAIWQAIADSDDWSPLAAKLADIRTMAEAYGAATLEMTPDELEKTESEAMKAGSGGGT